ncbi:MAG: hypothetical protein WCO10_02495 [bacterium]
MEKYKKYLTVSNLTIAGVVLVLLVSVIVYATKSSNKGERSAIVENSSNVATSTTATSSVKTKTAIVTTKVSYASKCGLVVTYPTVDSKVSFPLTAKGIVDNSNADKLGCSWNQALSRGGTAQVFYNLRKQGWKEAGIPVPIFIGSDVASSTTFSAPLNIHADALGLTSGTPIKITFTELTDLNVTQPDTLDLQVFLK